jgi:hypothetical protein
MADIATAIISGSFAVAGSLGSVWLKDYLERRSRIRTAQPAPSDRIPAVPPHPATSVVAVTPVPGFRLRPLFIALIGFAVGAVPYSLLPMPRLLVRPKIVALGILCVVVLFLIIHHARLLPGRGLGLFQLEVLSLWAAFAFGASLVYGPISSRWSTPLTDYYVDALGPWVISATAGLLLIPQIRRLSRRPP